MAPRPKCRVCGSKKWHKEPSSGLLACSEGHVLLDHRNETNEADEMGPHAVRKRTLKSTRVKKEKESKADDKLYHGHRGRYHYFQCQQLLLRHQVAALISIWKLPPEFEIVCRDIWALHLSELPDSPPAEPYFHSQELKDEPSPQIKEHSGPDSPYDSDEGPKPTPDSELADLLRINSESSSSEGDEDAAPSNKGNVPLVKSKSKRKAGRYAYEGPASNIAVLLFACWTMRLPAIARDFTRVIESRHLPYFDPMQYLPSNMTEHLNKYNTQAMSPRKAPSTMALHSLTSRLATRLHSNYKIITPEVNAAPILWRTTRCLGGNPTLYALTKRISRILSLPLTLHPSLAPKLVKVKHYDSLTRKLDSIPPEVALLSAGIVILKMVYGLDGGKRMPKDSADPACSLPRLEEYIDSLKKLHEAEYTNNHAIFDSSTNLSIADLDDDEMDKYLSFCENSLPNVDAKDADYKSAQRILEEHFPLKKHQSPQGTRQKSATPPAKLSAITVERKTKALLPGEEHRIYNAKDIFGTLPPEYQLILDRASTWVNVETDFLMAVVESFERRLLNWQKDKQRGKGREEQLDSEPDSDD